MPGSCRWVLYGTLIVNFLPFPKRCSEDSAWQRRQRRRKAKELALKESSPKSDQGEQKKKKKARVKNDEGKKKKAKKDGTGLWTISVTMIDP